MREADQTELRIPVLNRVILKQLSLVCYTIPDGLVQSGASILYSLFTIGDWKGNNVHETLTVCLVELFKAKGVEITEDEFRVLK